MPAPLTVYAVPQDHARVGSRALLLYAQWPVAAADPRDVLRDLTAAAIELLETSGADGTRGTFSALRRPFRPGEAAPAFVPPEVPAPAPGDLRVEVFAAWDAALPYSLEDAARLARALLRERYAVQTVHVGGNPGAGA